LQENPGGINVISKGFCRNKDYNKSDEDKILDICYDIDLKYDILIDVHLLSTNELETKRGKQPVFVNALKYGIYA